MAAPADAITRYSAISVCGIARANHPTLYRFWLHGRCKSRSPFLHNERRPRRISAWLGDTPCRQCRQDTSRVHRSNATATARRPPQRNATLNQNSNTAMQERDRHIRAIERHGRREWYKLSGCTKRSMVENAVYRYKATIGPEMRTRTLAGNELNTELGARYSTR